MFALTRAVRSMKDLIVPSSAASAAGAAGAAATPSAGTSGAGLRTLVRVALGPAVALPQTARSLPALLMALGQRGAAIPLARRRAPNAGLALKALAGLVISEGAVREGYLSLLTATMDRDVSDDVHPAFLDLLGQVNDDELLLLRRLDGPGPFPVLSMSSRLRHGGASRVELHHFSLLGEQAGCHRPERTPAYLDNLMRMGFAELRPTRVTDDMRMFQELESHPIVVAARARIESQPTVRIGPLSETIVADVQYQSLFMTPFGQQFRAACFFRPDLSAPTSGPLS